MKYLLIILKIFFVTSTCFCQKYVGTNIKPSVLNKTGYLTPFSQILYLKSSAEKDLSNELNEKIIIKSNAYLSEIITNFELPAEFVKLDFNEHNIYQRNIKTIVEKIIVDGEILKYNPDVFSYHRKTVTKVVNKIIIPDSLLAIIKMTGKKLMLSIGTFGYIKTKDFSANHPNKSYNNPNYGVGYGGILSYLLNNPNKCCKSINYAVIIDSEEKNIAYFHIVVDEINPANDESIKKMSHAIFEDYWIWYHPEAQQYLKIKQK